MPRSLALTLASLSVGGACSLGAANGDPACQAAVLEASGPKLLAAALQAYPQSPDVQHQAPRSPPRPTPRPFRCLPPLSLLPQGCLGLASLAHEDMALQSEMLESNTVQLALQIPEKSARASEGAPSERVHVSYRAGCTFGCVRNSWTL